LAKKAPPPVIRREEKEEVEDILDILYLYI
jgi:hypothetical protein